jgi:hypothetical protein
MATPRRRPAQRTATERNRHGAEGAVWHRIVTFVTGRDHGICHICGHAGAKIADHVIPVTERPDLALDAANLKAAHGYARGGSGECETCSAAAGKPVYCNEIRGAMSVERARRVIETRTGLALGPQAGSQPQGERDWLLEVAQLLVEPQLVGRVELSRADPALVLLPGSGLHCLPFGFFFHGHG